jgi:hypothetical protein
LPDDRYLTGARTTFHHNVARDTPTCMSGRDSAARLACPALAEIMLSVLEKEFTITIRTSRHRQVPHADCLYRCAMPVMAASRRGNRTLTGRRASSTSLQLFGKLPQLVRLDLEQHGQGLVGWGGAGHLPQFRQQAGLAQGGQQARG